MISGSACSHVRLEMLNFCLGCQDADIILRKYYSLSSSVVRDDESNGSSAKREVGKVAKTLEMQRHIFRASSGIAVAALVCLSSPDMIWFHLAKHHPYLKHFHARIIESVQCLIASPSHLQIESMSSYFQCSNLEFVTKSMAQLQWFLFAHGTNSRNIEGFWSS